MRVLLFYFVMLSVNAFATDSIYTWGYGEIFSKVLQGVTILSQDSYIFKSAIGVGGLLLMIKTTASNVNSSDMNIALGKYLFTVTILLGLFQSTTKQYIVEDEITNQTFVINNVPVGIGETFSAFTALERSLGKAFEVAFATPNSLNYTEVGMGFSMAAPLNVKSLRVADGYIKKTFNDYMDNCIMSAISTNDIPANKVSMSTLLKKDLRVTRFLTPYYSEATPDGVDMPCQDAWDILIDTDITQQLEVMEPILAAEMGISADKYKSGMGATSQLLFGISQNSKDYLMQQTIINMYNDGVQAVAIATGGDAQALAYSMAMATANQQQTFTTLGMMAQKNLPMYKAILTVLSLGIFMLLVILSLVYGNLEHVKMGFTLLFTMVLWTPLAIILNAMTFILIQSQVRWPTLDGGLTMLHSLHMHEQLALMIAMIGYVATLIPVLAYSIASKSTHGFVSMFSNMGSVTSSAAGAGAAQTSSGNLSTGNTSVGGLRATDSYGNHEWMGTGWKSNSIGQDGSINEHTRATGGNAGIGKTTAGGNADIAINMDSGKILKIANSTLSANSSEGLSEQVSRSLQETKQAGDSFAKSFSKSLGHNINASGQSISTDTFTKNDALSASESTTLSKTHNESVQNALNTVFKQGRNITFTSKDAASGALNGEVSLGVPELFKTFAGVGFKTGANGSITLTGEASDGKDYSYTLSGAETKTFATTYQQSMSKAMSEQEGVAIAMAKQVQTVKGFGDSEALNDANNFTKSYQEHKALQEQHQESRKYDLSLNTDLLPKMVNQFIDNTTAKDGDFEGYKLADVREANKLLASDVGFKMFKDGHDNVNSPYRQDYLNAVKSVMGDGFNPGENINAKSVIEQNEQEFTQLQNDANKNGNAVQSEVKKIIPQVTRNVNQAPENLTELTNEQKEVQKLYEEESKTLKTDAKKELKDFSKQESLGLKNEIEQTTDKIENNFNKAKTEVSIAKAVAQNPAMQTLANVPVYSANGDIKDGNGEKTGEWSRKPPQGTTYRKVDPDDLVDSLKEKGVVDTVIFGNSKIKNWGAIEKLSLPELQAMKKYDDWSPKDDKRIDDLIQKQEKQIKTISQKMKEMKGDD